MTKRVLIVLVLAAVVAGGAFGQVVLGIGGNYSKTKTDQTGNPTVTTSSFGIPVSLGYRMDALGFGLDAVYGGSSSEPLTGPSRDSTNLEIGGYVEYDFLKGEKLSLWGKAGLGYLGGFDVTVNNGLGRSNGFYLKLTPSLEYQMFKHVSVFAACDLLSFSLSSSEQKKVLSGNSWISVPSNYSYKRTTTSLTFPITQPLTSVTIGAKVVF
ncbi:MAG: porin family protein [Treponema sp.]|jgi:hypothetical protein|nr:porin family protein [Treponema sp.]